MSRHGSVGGTRFKVCCIASVAEARLAVSRGASALGLVSAMPSGPGVISEPQIAAIAACVPPGVSSVLLTSLTEPAAIAAQQRRCGTSVIQLCDWLSPGERAALQQALPGVRLMQVVHVTGPEALEQAREAEQQAHALLLDSGRPNAAVKSLGGTGQTHDWTLSREICAAATVPVYLAGGLSPDNVARAVREVRPFGVDACSGLRRDGQLDADKLDRFVNALGAAAASPDRSAQPSV